MIRIFIKALFYCDIFPGGAGDPYQVHKKRLPSARFPLLRSIVVPVDNFIIPPRSSTHRIVETRIQLVGYHYGILLSAKMSNSNEVADFIGFLVCRQPVVVGDRQAKEPLNVIRDIFCPPAPLHRIPSAIFCSLLGCAESGLVIHNFRVRGIKENSSSRCCRCCCWRSITSSSSHAKHYVNKE